MEVNRKVWRTEFSKTVRVIRPFSTAATKAAISPNGRSFHENEVHPVQNGNHSSRKITTGAGPHAR